MITLKYLGGITPEYQNHLVTIPVGGSAELPDEIALVLLRDFPTCFERIDTRSVDKPPHDRMKREPTAKRVKI